MPRSYDLPPISPELRAGHPLAWNLGACFTMHDWLGAGGLFDLSPMGAHLTESSAVARRAGPFGPEAFFNDGSTQYLRGSTGGLSSTTSMTCSCIAMTTKSNDLPQEVWGKDSSTAGYPRWMLRFRYTTDIEFAISTAAGYNQCSTSSNPVASGEYAHLLGTRNGTTVTLYLNGRQVATATGSTNDWRAGASYLHLGYRSTTYPTPLAGAVVSARYWYDRVLTPAEILLDAEDHWDLLRPRSLRVVWSAPGGGEVHNGAAAVAVAGTLTAAGHAVRAGAAAVAGSATVTAAGSAVRAGAVAVSAAGSIAVAGHALRAGAATVAAAGSLTAAGHAVRAGAAAIASAGTMAVSASVIRSGTAAVAGALTVTISGGMPTPVGAASIAASAALSASGSVVRAGVAAFHPVLAAVVYGSTRRAGAASLTGMLTLTVAELPAVLGMMHAAGEVLCDIAMRGEIVPDLRLEGEVRRDLAATGAVRPVGAGP